MGAGTHVRVNFDKDEDFTKEENAAFFRGLEGKPAAIPADLNELFFTPWIFGDHRITVLELCRFHSLFRASSWAIRTLAAGSSFDPFTAFKCEKPRKLMYRVFYSFCPNLAGCDRR